MYDGEIQNHVLPAFTGKLEALDRTIALIEKTPDRYFDISNWMLDEYWCAISYVPAAKEGCGTVACIAGWTVTANYDQDRSGQPVCVAAEDILGLSDIAADNLFMPADMAEPDSVTRARALAVLRHLRQTNEVEWDRFDLDGSELVDT